MDTTDQPGTGCPSLKFDTNQAGRPIEWVKSVSSQGIQLHFPRANRGRCRSHALGTQVGDLRQAGGHLVTEVAEEIGQLCLLNHRCYQVDAIHTLKSRPGTWLGRCSQTAEFGDQDR